MSQNQAKLILIRKRTTELPWFDVRIKLCQTLFDFDHQQLANSPMLR